MRRWWHGRRDRSGTEPVAALEGAVIGDLEGPTGVVDRFGRVGARDESWRIEWGVGAGDRWRVAHEEVAVRQHRVADAPVWETWMRVPSGDVVQRVAAAADGTGRVVVLEFENLSADAVAVAVVGCVAGPATVAADADGVSIDDVEWIRPDRPAGGVLAVDVDPWPVVAGGPDAGRTAVEGARPAGGVVLALPHRQTVRVLVAVEGDFPARPVTPAEIGAGWRTVTADALSIEVPDADLGEAWDRILPDLVVLAGTDDPLVAAEVAVPLDAAGLDREADRARATVVAAAERGALRGGAAVAAMRALASRDLLTGRESGLVDLAGPLAAAAGAALDASTLELVARALEPHAPDAAQDARRAAAGAAGGHAVVTEAARAAAQVLSRVLADDGASAVSLLPEIPSSWRGRPIDVRRAGTAHGTVSFSVRWHGERPALLWERVGGDDGVELRCPGLDPTWSTVERVGEALLAPPGG